MTINERVSPKRLAEIIARAEVCDDSVLTDYRDIESIARELQQYRAGAEPVIPDGLHPATADLVLRFATALAEKLHKAEQKYGYSDNWQQNDWYEECLQSLWEHIKKGDPRDVAAYCAFMWHHDWATTDYDRGVQKAVDSIAAPQITSVPDEHYRQLSDLYHAQEKRLFKLTRLMIAAIASEDCCWHWTGWESKSRAQRQQNRQSSCPAIPNR